MTRAPCALDCFIARLGRQLRLCELPSDGFLRNRKGGADFSFVSADEIAFALPAASRLLTNRETRADFSFVSADEIAFALPAASRPLTNSEMGADFSFVSADEIAFALPGASRLLTNRETGADSSFVSADEIAFPWHAISGAWLIDGLVVCSLPCLCNEFSLACVVVNSLVLSCYAIHQPSFSELAGRHPH